jgi:surfactin synthase thioesterase subunit
VTKQAVGSALWRLSSASDAPRLLCLHHAGGNGAFYLSWACRAAHLRPELPPARRDEAELTGLLRSWGGTLPELLTDEEFLGSVLWRGIHVLAGKHFYLVPARRLVLDVVMRAVTEGAG